MSLDQKELTRLACLEMELAKLKKERELQAELAQLRAEADLEPASLGLPGVQGDGAASEGGSAAKEGATVMEWAGLSAMDSAGNAGLGHLLGRLVYDAEEDADLPRVMGGGLFRYGQQTDVRGRVLRWVSSS